MDPKDKARLREALLREQHRWLPYEERKERKRRAQERRANAPRRRPRKKDWSEDDEAEGIARLSDREGVVPVRASHAAAAERELPAFGPTATIVGLRSGYARVLLDGEELEVELAEELARTQQASVAVGDRARLEPRGEGYRVVAVDERTSVLARPDPGNLGRQRVLAANVDLGVVVLSVVAPPLRPALVDRFLVALDVGGVRPVLCVNKVDLLDGAEDRARVERVLEPYRRLGIPVLLVSAAEGEGIAELAGELAGSTCVFVGHSGVGKSSLLNALDPDADRDTVGVREGDGKGRHTTTASSLVELSSGLRLVDTPGIREFGLWQLDAATLRGSFREFEPLASRCRFSDCTHVHEPGCAVIAAVERDEVSRSRYEAYLRLLDEVEP